MQISFILPVPDMAVPRSMQVPILKVLIPKSIRRSRRMKTACGFSSGNSRRRAECPATADRTSRIPCERGLHLADEVGFGGDESGGVVEAGFEIVDLGSAERGGDEREIGVGIAGDGETEIVHRPHVFVVLERGAVGIGGVLETAVVQALGGVTHDDGGAPWTEGGSGQVVSVGEFADVVAIHLDEVPALAEPVVEIGRGKGFGDGAINAEGVEVERDDQVFDAEAGGEVARLVAHAFLGLGVAADDEGFGREAAGTMQDGETEAGGEAVAGGTGGSVGEGVLGFHVAAGAAPAAEAGELFGEDGVTGILAGEGEAFAAQSLIDERDGGVKERRAVAGGPYHAAAAGVLGTAGVEAENAAG